MNGIRCALLLGLISAAPAVAQMVGPPVTPAPHSRQRARVALPCSSITFSAATPDR